MGSYSYISGVIIPVYMGYNYRIIVTLLMTPLKTTPEPLQVGGEFEDLHLGVFGLKALGS